MASWHRLEGAGKRLVLELYVQPGAKRTEACGLHDGALKIRVAAPAEDQRANRRLLAFLENTFAVTRKQVRLLRGERARHKVVEITAPNAPPEALWTEVAVP